MKTSKDALEIKSLVDKLKLLEIRMNNTEIKKKGRVDKTSTSPT